MNRDFELANGLQDADIEMHDLEQAARHQSALKRKGICVHGWRKIGQWPDKTCTCLDCGRVFATEADCDEETREILI